MRHIGGSRGFERFALIAAFAMLFRVSAVTAQTVEPLEDNEVLIGTTGDDGASHVGSDRFLPGSKDPADASKADASEYVSGKRALDAGDFAAAQRWFERSLAADPDGPDSAEARRHLGRLYTAPIYTAPGTAAAPTSPSVSIRDGAGADDPRESKQVGAAPGQNRIKATLQATSDEDQFLIEAGDRVFFGPGSADLGGRARSVLAAQAKWLTARPGFNVSVEGHADDPSLSEQELEDLSEARAIAVRERLIGEGVDAARIAIVPWGRSQPIAACPEPACQAQNRRVVSVLTPRYGPGKRNLSSSQPLVPRGQPLTASRDEAASGRGAAMAR